MLVSKINSTNFKSIITDDFVKYTEREEAIKNDIITKLKRPYPKDSQGRNYNQYLKEEKNVDVYLTKERGNPDSVKVVGLWRAKIEDNKIKNPGDDYYVGEYHSFNFNPDDVLEGKKNFIKSTLASFLGIGLPLALIVLCFFGVSKSVEQTKEMPKKIIQMKDSIVDSLKVTKLGEKIIK